MKWRAKALEHAKAEDPNEACGVLLCVKGKEVYYPCKNIAAKPKDIFVIDPEDWAKAEEKGEVLAVVHSHPVTSPEPSEADRVACEKSGLKWWIVQPNLETWGSCEPCGYVAPLIGRKWVWNATDCWSLCRDWYQQELGITLRDWDRPTSSDAFVLNPMFDRCWRDTGFRELEEKEEWKRGDLLLMSVNSGGLNHIGVYLGEDLILHHLENRLSSRDPITEWHLKCIGRRIRYAQG
jgi:proteasome lid subunit RPN8/RPN11